MTFIVLDDLRGHFLVGSHHLAQVFRVKFAGEVSGTHQVAEHHGELAAFGFGGRARWFRWDDRFDL
jgi:hypothetical protein